MEAWLGEHTAGIAGPEVLVSSTKSRWRPVMTSVPQGLILGPVPFNIIDQDEVDPRGPWQALDVL